MATAEMTERGGEGRGGEGRGGKGRERKLNYTKQT